MIKAIGYNKVVLILLFALFIVAAFIYNAKVLAPNLKKKQAELSTHNAKISEITTNLTLLKDGLEKFEKQKTDFERVSQLGFFNPQDRVNAKQLITAIQQDSRLLSAKYAIKPAQTVTNKKLEEANYKILQTAIDFNLEAVEDVDIYKFIYILNYGFPGQVIINDFSISKEMEITQPLLRKIGVGEDVPVVKASLNVTWQTMVPLEEEGLANVSQEGENVR